MTGIEEGCGRLRIQESETVALALILNELVSNAVKHSHPAPDQTGITASLLLDGEAGWIRISNPGTLAPGFDLVRGVGLGSGLGLVRALLPTQGVALDLHREGDRVVTELRIAPPILQRPPERKENA